MSNSQFLKAVITKDHAWGTCSVCGESKEMVLMQVTDVKAGYTRNMFSWETQVRLEWREACCGVEWLQPETPTAKELKTFTVAGYTYNTDPTTGIFKRQAPTTTKIKRFNAEGTVESLETINHAHTERVLEKHGITVVYSDPPENVDKT